MELFSNRIFHIVVVHVGILVLVQLSHWYLPDLNRKHVTGLYLVLMPIGFGLFGWEVPYWLTAVIVCLGLTGLLMVVKRALRPAN